MLCPARGSKKHQLCLESIKAPKISHPCMRGSGWGDPPAHVWGGWDDACSIGAQRERPALASG